MAFREKSEDEKYGTIVWKMQVVHNDYSWRKEAWPAVVAELRKCHAHFHKVTGINLRRIAAVAAARLEAFPALKSLDEKIKAGKDNIGLIRTTISLGNSKARRRTATPEQKAAIEAIRHSLAIVYGEKKALLEQIKNDAAWSAKIKIVSEPFFDEAKAANAASGIYWGTLGRVNQAAMTAKHPQRFDATGHLSIQFQGGLRSELLLGRGSPQLSLAPFTRRNICDPGNPKQTMANVRFLIRRDKIGDETVPVYLSFQCHYDRPIPDDTEIIWAQVVIKKVGWQRHAYLHLSLRKSAELRAANDRFFTKPDAATTGRVAVELGWRVMEDRGIRVAVWKGDDGQGGDLRLPADFIKTKTHLESLVSIRKEIFNRVHKALVAWLKLADKSRLPEWLKKDAEFIHAWKAPRRLAILAGNWLKERFDGDDRPMSAMEGSIHYSPHVNGKKVIERADATSGARILFSVWNRQNRHLYQWESDRRVKLIDHRSHLYQTFAAMLRRKYKTAVVEDIDWGKLALGPKPEDAENKDAIAMYRATAAVATLRGDLEKSMVVVRVDPKNTTKRHSKCRRMSGQAKPEKLIHVCQHDGESFDQDESAAENLLEISA